MTLRFFAQIAVVVSVAVVATSPLNAWPHKHGQRAQVRFLATSTLIRGTWGQNEDTYLAQMILPRQNEAVLVRLVDAYPNETPPLSRAVLISDSGTVLRVQRDEGCDRRFGEFPLRTAPGDPMAILLEPLSYRPHLDHSPQPESLLPCYRTVRQ